MNKKKSIGEDGTQDTAVIGLACRFGGDAVNAEAFWKMLCEGRGMQHALFRQ